jgi:O-6-methylguanine DNA methyltransferase
MTIGYTILETALGEVLTAEHDGALVFVAVGKDGLKRLTAMVRKRFPKEPIIPTVLDSGKQIQGFLKGKRQAFDLKLNPGGTDFQRKVWKALQRIPYGKTRTYSQIAKQIKHPNSARAVGQACGANPLPLVVPCHRVVAADGKLGGFGLGLECKQRLLDIESGKGR